VINGNEDYSSSDDDVALSSVVSYYEWKKNVDVMSSPVFCEYVGVLGKVKEEGDKLQPVDVFLVLFEDKLIEHITFQTNLYATEKGKTFKNVTKGEMKVFLQ
jgi:hypothetical protein